MISCARISGKAGREGVFQIPSTSHAGESWVVVYQPGTDHWCACPGFKYRGMCRHVIAAENAVREEVFATPAVTDPEDIERRDRRLREIEELFR